MSTKNNIVTLSNDERTALETVARSTHRSGREKTRARILLLADTGRARAEGASRTDAEIAAHLRVAPLTVSQVRQRAVERGAVASLAHKAQEKRKARKLDGAQEAHLIAVTCSAPPVGRARWTLQLLRKRLIEMEVVESIGTETIRQTLKKTASSRG